jgi:hypothetical protein
MRERVAIEQGDSFDSPRASQAGSEKIDPAPLLSRLRNRGTSHFLQLLNRRIRIHSAQNEQARCHQSRSSYALAAVNHNIFAGCQLRIKLIQYWHDFRPGSWDLSIRNGKRREPQSLILRGLWLCGETEILLLVWR